MKLIASTAFLALGLSMFSVGASAPVSAEEYFIPMGKAYSPSQNRLPKSYSRQSRVYKQTDILETEIYRRKQADKAFFEHFRTFIDRDLFYPGRSYSDY